jgi:hypothetical protein
MFVILQMLIFSLGKSLQQVVKDAEYEQGKLNSVLESMVRPNPSTRSSLMDLLDVSTLYCKQRRHPLFSPSPVSEDPLNEVLVCVPPIACF